MEMNRVERRKKNVKLKVTTHPFEICEEINKNEIKNRKMKNNTQTCIQYTSTESSDD